MSHRAVIRNNTYRDSIFLMKLSAQAARESGAATVSAMMATDRNKELFTDSGLMTPDIASAKANDLAIAIEGDDAQIAAAEAVVNRMLDESPSGDAADERDENLHTVRQAARKNGKFNLALISVAGDYARYEAAEALASNMDVMLYSDNISLADELALKSMAVKKGLIVMGPDCGTAIIDGVPLAFANVVRPGPVGIIGASGTGLQEVTCLLDRLGVGINQAYGIGGRDLKDDIGGLSCFVALERLAKDDDVKAIVILGKPPGKATRAKILERVKTLGKPVFVHYVGADDYAPETAAGIVSGLDLTELSLAVAKHFNKDAALDDNASAPDAGKRSGYLVGIFGGGTLAQEAAVLCGKKLSGPKATNLSVPGYEKITGKDSFDGHVFWDLGEDEFTVGRPHPMMAPDLKMDRLVDALCNPHVGVVLMDMVIGYGSHPAQADLAIEALERAATQSNGESRNKLVVASVCGTDKDRPSRKEEVKKLRDAGIVVLATNAIAASYAADALAR
ncbi:MAG: acyl-CoA synthetase FdrA [Planctomycetes bacterium]|nr:acyl-CoA synthetase FdrA [Planctomycetota bacterium]